MRRTRERLTRFGLVLGLGLALLACEKPPPEGASAIGEPEGSYRAEIRRTAYGVPHIVAEDYGSLGFGAGYVAGEDNVCLLADLYLTGGAERSRFLGAEDGNLERDFFYRRLVDLDVVREPGLHPELDALHAGAAAGYNRYLRDVGIDGISDPACRGQSWVREATRDDALRLTRTSQFQEAFLFAIVGAAPPATAGGTDAGPGGPELPSRAAIEADLRARGSNAIALGREATRSGRGIFLGNPHQPWSGRYRFYHKHFTIPGHLDMIGASPVPMPSLAVGHNEWVAWNGTVSTATRYSFYRLELAPDRPTIYLFDGEPRAMDRDEVSVWVRGADGALERRTHTFYSSHFGPVIETREYPWTSEHAWVLRNVDQGWRGANETHELQRARSVREFKRILERHQGFPVNLIAADATGEVLYADLGPAAHLTDAQLDDCALEGGLDGSRTSCQWGSDPDAVVPGIFGPSSLPHLFRTDWVHNSNSSYWLTNPDHPLVGFPRSLGDEVTPRSLRTRLAIRMIQERLAGSDGLEGKGFTLGHLQTLMFGNRNYAAELVRGDLVKLCSARPDVTLADGARVDLREACRVLSEWDLRVDLESRGAHLFREFFAEGGVRFAVPFDPADPLNTPHTLDPEDPGVLAALGRAVRRLLESGLALDAPLGEVQYVQRGERVIPIHGGPGREGIFNNIRAPFRGELGYPEVRSGSSFIMAVEFTEAGPVSRSLVTYSQSIDPTSPHHSDQTELFSRKQWVRMLFREAEILADPELRAYTVTGPR